MEILSQMVSPALAVVFITVELLLREGHVFAYLLVIGILFMIIQEPRPETLEI